MLKRDCLLLHSLKIIDYSLLLAIYSLDKCSPPTTRRSNNTQSSQTQIQAFNKLLSSSLDEFNDRDNHKYFNYEDRKSMAAKSEMTRLTSLGQTSIPNSLRSNSAMDIVTDAYNLQDLGVNVASSNPQQVFENGQLPLHGRINSSATTGYQTASNMTSSQMNSHAPLTMSYSTGHNTKPQTKQTGANQNSNNNNDPHLSIHKQVNLTRNLQNLHHLKHLRLSSLGTLNDLNSIYSKGIPATMPNGERLLIFVGIIDILQDYKFRKKLEHHLKSLIVERDSLSVQKPKFYQRRFVKFIELEVFTAKKYQMSQSLGDLTMGME